MQPSNFKYEDSKQLDLHPLVHSLVDLSKATEPNFPVELMRKVGEDIGLQINEQTMCQMLAHIADFSINQLLNQIKQSKVGKKSSTTILNADVVKTLNLGGADWAGRPYIYQQFQHTHVSVNSLEKELNWKQNKQNDDY